MIDEVMELLEGAACPSCRGRLRRRSTFWSCSSCELLFPEWCWLWKIGELYPFKRSAIEPISTPAASP